MGRPKKVQQDREPGIVGYVRVSTNDQGNNGHGLDAQRQAIRAEAERRGIEVLHIYQDVQSGKGMTKRPQLQAALDQLERGRGHVLMVAKLDRLSRSVIDAATLFERARSQGWQVVSLDLMIDMSSPQGELMANVMIAFAQWERRVIGMRTREGLGAARAKGVKIGRRQEISDELDRRIVEAYTTGGKGLSDIMHELRAEGVPTTRGGEWHTSTVWRVLKRHGAV